MGGLFEVLSSSFEKKTTDISNYTWAELFPWATSRSGVSVNVDTALRVSTVLACARVLAEGVAQLPLKLYRVDGDKKTLEDSPVAKLLSRYPNDWMTSFEMRETMTMHAVLLGNAYAYVGYGGGKIQEIIPLVPSQVTPVRGTGINYGYTYRVTDLSGNVTTLDQSNVLHIRGPSWNGYLGMDVVQLAREAIGLAIVTEEAHASLHANGAQPGGVLSVKGKLDQAGRDRLKASWKAFQEGVANKFKTAVLDMDASWTPMSMTGVDSQHLETRRFQIEEICRAMRVFPQMVMHSDKSSTFASAESFFTAHVVHSLMPWVTRWEQSIERQLLADDDALVCKLNVNALLRGTPTERADFYLKALGGSRELTAWLTRNEVRALEEYDPIDGGDKLPEPPPPPVGAGGATPGGAVPSATTTPPAASKTFFFDAETWGWKEFNPDQPRGPDGRWEGGGGGLGSHPTPASALYDAQNQTTDVAGVLAASPPGTAKAIEQVQERIAQGVPTNAPTSLGGFKNVDGTYTAERQALHQKIIGEMLNEKAVAAATPPAGEKPTATFLGGRGGSGKSFLTSPGGPADASTAIMLNSDHVQESLPGYEGWNAAHYHDEAADIVAQASTIARNTGLNVIHDATMRSESSLAKSVLQYQSAGYKVNGYYVFASPKTAATRAIGRFVRGGTSGRFVPPEYVLGSTTNERTFDAMKPSFSKWAVYDNNTTGSPPKLVAKSK